MKKLFLSILLLVGIGVLVSGCFKRDTLEGVTIYTTIYPIEYLTSEIYGYNSTVKSIYPDGVNVNEYKLTSKQIRDYSVGALFIYNGLSDEKKIAADFINYNKSMRIIDVSQGLEYQNDVEELWMSPVNYLMLAQNIRNSLKEYIENKYIKEEIDKKYDNLKIKISELDAELKIIAENANNKTIVAGSNMFKFLEKYEFEVIVLENDAEVTNSTYKKVINLIAGGSVKRIFLKGAQEFNDTLNKLKSETKVEFYEINTAGTLSDEQRESGINYLDIMKENIDAIKKELYE